MKRKNLAFSMAEVMITLVILGVIAVLTVPGLVDSANKRINEAAESKADYVIGQGALRLQAECPRLRCSDPQATLTNLLESVKANEKLTYGVSTKDTANNKLYVLVVIEGDDTPILFAVDSKGKGALATSDEFAVAKTLTYNKIVDSNGNVKNSTTIANADSSYTEVKIAGSNNAKYGTGIISNDNDDDLPSTNSP